MEDDQPGVPNGAQLQRPIPRILRVKLVLLGSSGVGKSSLALRFSNNDFRDSTTPTVGCEFNVHICVCMFLSSELKENISKTCTLLTYNNFTFLLQAYSSKIFFEKLLTQRKVNAKHVADIFCKCICPFKKAGSKVIPCQELGGIGELFCSCCCCFSDLDKVLLHPWIL